MVYLLSTLFFYQFFDWVRTIEAKRYENERPERGRMCARRGIMDETQNG